MGARYRRVWLNGELGTGAGDVYGDPQMPLRENIVPLVAQAGGAIEWPGTSFARLRP